MHKMSVLEPFWAKKATFGAKKSKFIENHRSCTLLKIMSFCPKNTLYGSIDRILFLLFKKKEKNIHFLGLRHAFPSTFGSVKNLQKLKKIEKKSWIVTTSSFYLCALCVHIMHENIKFLKYKKNPIDRSIQRIFWTKTHVWVPFCTFFEKSAYFGQDWTTPFKLVSQVWIVCTDTFDISEV